MLKLLKNKNVKIKTKIALVLLLIAAICAVINLFLGDENLRIIIWALVICVWAIDYLVICEDVNKYEKENILLGYEVDLLRWSYRSMGKYIDYMNLPELEDIDTRISNELNDIEIKKEDYAERLGLKP